MKVSFVIPAYNEEASVGDCIRAIEREAKTVSVPCEIIVVNNASTDKTHEVAASFAGVRVVDEPKKGIVSARAAGYAVSTGDIVANIDADTRLTPGWLARVVREFERNPKLAGLSGPYIYYDLPLRTRIAVRIFYLFGFVLYIVDRFILGVGSMLQGGNFVVARWAMDKAGGFDTTISFYGEDTDVARRLQQVGDVKFTFGLPALSSGRRLAKEGVIRMGLRYAANHLSVIYWKKPVTETYTDIRK